MERVNGVRGLRVHEITNLQHQESFVKNHIWNLSKIDIFCDKNRLKIFVRNSFIEDNPL